MNLIDHWWMISFVLPLLLIATFLIVRYVLIWFDHRHSRSMKSYSMRYGACEYFGKSRANFRVGKS